MNRMELLVQANHAGVSLYTENGKLKFRAKEGALSEELREALRNGREELIQALEEEKRKERLPLTPIQMAYLLGSSPGVELGGWNANYYLECETEDLDAERFEEALNEMIRLHDCLRLRILPEGSQIVETSLPYVRLHSYGLVDDKEIERIRKERIRHVYLPGDWPLFSFGLSRLPSGKEILHMDFDCMILDATSARGMMEELFRRYKGEEMEPLSYSFAEYLKREKKAAPPGAEEYWKKRAEEMPGAPSLPYTRPFAEVRDPEYGRLEAVFSKEETLRIFEKCRKNCVTPASLIATAFMISLSKASREKDLSINLTLFHRDAVHKDVFRVLGDFTNIGFLSYEHREGESLLEAVQRTQKQSWKLLQYRSYDGTEVLKFLRKGQAGKAVMPVVFTSVLGSGEAEWKEEKFREVLSVSRTPQVSLDHHVREQGGNLKLSFDYVKEVFLREDIEKIFDSYTLLIHRIAEEEDWKNIRIEEETE